MPINPNDLDIPPLQLRRALASTVSNYVAAEGEPVWATDTKKLYVGDGSTVGGIEVGGTGGSSTVTDQLLFTTSSVTFAGLDVNGNIEATTVNGVFVGERGSSNGNAVLGNGAMDIATSNATYNTAVGENAMAALTDGDYNTAAGFGSLAAMSTGNYNTAIGVNALTSANGTGNTALGQSAGQSLGTGDYNTFIDYDFTATTNVSNTVFIGNTASEPKLKLTDTTTFIRNIAASTNTNVLYYNTTTKEITYGVPTGGGGTSYDQSLNTTNNVIFKSVQSTEVVSAGGYPLDSNGDALILNANTQTPAIVVSNYTSGLVPAAVIRGYGQNTPGGTTATVGSAALTLEASRGTHTSPTSIQSGNSLGALGWGGYDGARWSSDVYLNPVQMAITATENWAGNATTSTNAGARWFIRSQPMGVQLNTTSRHFDILTAQTAGSASAPPTHQLLLGQADNASTTLRMANGVDTHVGHGATSILYINAKQEIYGVPFEDAAVFTGEISGTTLTVTAVTSGILSVGQRVYGTGITTATFITALLTGTGGTGTYTVNNSQTVSSMTMNSGADNTTLNGSNTLTFVSGRKNGVTGRRNSLKNGDSLGRIIFNGQTANGQTSTGGRGAQIRVNALEDFSGSARGSSLTFTTVNEGTTTEANRLLLKSSVNQYTSNEHAFFDNSAQSLVTIASYGLRINQGSLYVGDPGEDGVIQTSQAGDDLTIQTNDGSTGGKIFLQEGGGVQLYAQNIEVVSASTSNFAIKDSLSSMRAEFRKDYSHSDTDQFEVRSADGASVIAAFNTSSGVRIYDAFNLPTAAPASNGEYLEGQADGTTAWTDRVNAKTIYENVKNVSGGSLSKGTPVYQIGVTGNTITVGRARADDPAKVAVGVLDETLADDAEGRMLVLGEIKGVNTAAFSTGDRVYLGSTGGYTDVPPTGSNFIQFLGIVNRINASNGSGFITGTLTADAVKTEGGVISAWDGTVWTPIQGTASTANISTTATTTIFTFDPAVYDTAKLTITVKDSGDYHAVEMLVVSDGTDVWSNEYSVVLSGTELATFTATISSGQVVVQAAATAPTDMTIKATASLTAV